MTKSSIARTALAAILTLFAYAAMAQPLPFPQNWTNAPTGKARQDVYPYDGQCWTAAPIGNLPQCTTTNAPSFRCDGGNGFSNQTAGGWGTCGSVTAAPLPLSLLTGDTQRANKYKWEVLNPLDYTPDTTKFANADYYEIGVHESWGFDGIAKAGLFPNPGFTVPNGKQWTGITDANGNPLLTPVWGVGQINMNGGPVTTTLQSLGLFPTKGFKSSNWSANNYVATWPSISIRGKTGRPVVVKWMNEFPNNHLFCPHPEAADWPCAIDRTFMGVKATIDPATAPTTFQPKAPGGLPFNAVNQYGGAQQPDNSWVTHLHGGEIPPQTDGFAEKWFGNKVTGALYSPVPWLLNPAFGAPNGAIDLVYRPGGTTDPWSTNHFDTYAYPMVNQESTIWFHDHTLGKTHHNVIAGPAGFFPVKDPSKHYGFQGGKCQGPLPDSCEYTWVDVVTEPRDSLGIPKYDLFLAIQDRDFNGDGTFNFPNGMANVLGASGYAAVPGNWYYTPGPNPQVHPVWVPEYFASNALVNGVIWPKKSVQPGWYRIRIVDGSDARCYNLSFSTTDPWANPVIDPITGAPAPVKPTSSIPFVVIANEQGYLRAPVNATTVTMCPGERYEFLFNFTGLSGQKVYMVNDAPGPFPGGGNGPFEPGSPYPDLATIMRFDVGGNDGVRSCPSGMLPSNTPFSCLAIPRVIDQDFDDLTGNSGGTPIQPCASQAPADTVGKRCIAAVRYLYLSERIDGTTGASLGLNINGVPFEYDVTETPREGTYEQWNIINTTVDAHPMHPHLGKFQIMGRQFFDVQGYKLALCQSDPASNDCTAGPAPGGVMQLIADPTPFLAGPLAALKPGPGEAGWKDAMRALPGQVLTFVGKWDGSWKGANGAAGPVTAPGAGNNSGTVGGDASQWVFPAVYSGPFVWHCHINSHEDSEMMRSSLVVK